MKRIENYKTKEKQYNEKLLENQKIIEQLKEKIENKNINFESEGKHNISQVSESEKYYNNNHESLNGSLDIYSISNGQPILKGLNYVGGIC